MTDFRTDDFEFCIVPTIITDRGAEMKRRICVAVAARDPETGLMVDTSVDLEKVVRRIEMGMFGGHIDGWWMSMPLDEKESYLEWNSSFDRDRLGVHPDLEEAAVEVPDNEDSIKHLFYEIVDGEIEKRALA